eukprot:scaffold3362_cov402-Prasinococcus_capsulatus_cf.AAC.12
MSRVTLGGERCLAVPSSTARQAGALASASSRAGIQARALRNLYGREVFGACWMNSDHPVEVRFCCAQLHG